MSCYMSTKAVCGLSSGTEGIVTAQRAETAAVVETNR